MIVKDLDGNESMWKISATPKSKKRTKKSTYHQLALKLIKKTYPIYPVCQETPINIHDNFWLYLDIYLPTINIALEIHGEQHYKFNTLFHKHKLDFVKQRRNDRLKREWCELNKVGLIVLPYNESVEQWLDRIESYEY